jgi:hypothetical protein
MRASTVSVHKHHEPHAVSVSPGRATNATSSAFGFLQCFFPIILCLFLSRPLHHRSSLSITVRLVDALASETSHARRAAYPSLGAFPNCASSFLCTVDHVTIHFSLARLSRPPRKPLAPTLSSRSPRLRLFVTHPRFPCNLSPPQPVFFPYAAMHGSLKHRWPTPLCVPPQNDHRPTSYASHTVPHIAGLSWDHISVRKTSYYTWAQSIVLQFVRSSIIISSHTPRSLFHRLLRYFYQTSPHLPHHMSAVAHLVTI